jgi:hypothetical protein
MTEDELLILVSAITVLSGMGVLLTAWWLWLRSRIKRGANPEELSHMRRAIDDMRLELDSVHRELTDGQQELHERLDFAERLLGQKHPERLPPPS